MQTMDEASDRCRFVGKGWRFERKREMRTLIMAAACLMAAWAAPLAAMDFGPAFPVPLSSLKIDMKNIFNVPVGGTLVALSDGFKAADTNAVSPLVQYSIPPEWSKGAKCDLLRVGSIMVERDTRKIAAAMSSCVYPSVEAGAFVITNDLHEAVIAVANRNGMFYPLRKDKDGTGIISYTWTSDGVPLVFDIRVAVNKRRQMAVSTMLHIKGDNLNARLAP